MKHREHGKKVGRLVFNRRAGESFMIGDDIKVMVARNHRGHMRIIVEAPRHIPVVRSEIYKKEGGGDEPETPGSGAARGAESDNQRDAAGNR